MKINRKAKDIASESGKEPRHGYHSRTYHNYFEGYEERKVIDKHGKEKIERNYVGKTYSRDVSDKMNIFIKIVYWFIYALILSAFIVIITRNIGANKVWWSIIGEFIAIIFLIILLIAVFDNSIAKRKMKIFDYRVTHQRIVWLSTILMGIFAYCLLSHLIYICVDQSSYLENLLWGLLYLLPILLCLLLRIWEGKTKYIETPFEGEKHLDAIEIEK